MTITDQRITYKLEFVITIFDLRELIGRFNLHDNSSNRIKRRAVNIMSPNKSDVRLSVCSSHFNGAGVRFDETSRPPVYDRMKTEIRCLTKDALKLCYWYKPTLAVPYI